MKNTSQFKDKKILVLGLAKSGFAAAKLLHSLGADVLVNDASPEEGNKEAMDLRSMGVQVICGGHPPGLLDKGVSLVVKNSGIPYTNPVVIEALEKKLHVCTEIDIS